ncbi:peptidase S24/S26A/S26B/S26C [Cryomyces antarcticus]|nr:hypothetical protein LTR04_006964 [Oleoguttula sp. CCFEE 6159]
MSFSIRHLVADFPWRLTAIYFPFAGAAVIFANDNILEIQSQTGDSMSPALAPTFHETGSRDKLAILHYNPFFNLRSEVKRGQIVSFWAPHDPEKLLVKRVIATEGDTVVVDKRRDRSVGEWARVVEGEGRIKVPFGHVWVEGDNWRKSKDSNDYGPVSKALLVGKVVAVVWPPTRVGWVEGEAWKGRTKVIPGKEERPAMWLNE